MSCTNCCNTTALANVCGFGVGLDAPSGTTGIGVLLTNSGSVSGSSAAFSVNFIQTNSSHQLTGWAQILFNNLGFTLIVHAPSLSQKLITSTFNSSLCYFMGLQITGGNIVGTVIDSNGNTFTASIATTLTSFTTGFVMTEDNANTYVFFQPVWGVPTVSGCGMSGTFWPHGFVFHGQSSSCSTYSTKETYASGPVEITLGPNATSSPTCGTLLW
ncbi:MAG: hypothetical protein ACREBJ_01005 [Nitrosotalea sp.]